VMVSGTLADGIPFAYSIARTGDLHVGKVIRGRWIKALIQVDGTPSYLLVRPGIGYDLLHAVEPVSKFPTLTDWQQLAYLAKRG